ncbi:MAG: ATP-binding protein [Verrucomicrobiota bacterium]
MEKESGISSEAMGHAVLAWMQDLSPQGICVTDNELRIRGWNSWLELNSGMEKKNVLGKNLFQVFPDLETRCLDAYFNKALAGGVSILSAAFHGHLFPFTPSIADSGFSSMQQTVRIAPLIHADEIVGTITIVEDVTEREHHNALLRKQYERQELFSWVLSHLLESTDPEKMVKEIFPQISVHIGMDAYFNFLLDEGGTRLRLHSAGGVANDVQEKFGTIELGENLSGTCALERRTVIWSEIQRSHEAKAQGAKSLGFTACICHPLLAQGKLIGTLAFALRKRNQFEPDEVEFTRVIAQYVGIALERSQNLNALNRAKEKLRSHAELLEKEVQERTRELLDSLNELQTFSYSLAHDVRAPLRHVRGYVEAMVEDGQGELTAKSREYIDLILKSIFRLDSLTEDILTYGQLSQIASPKTPVHLDDLLKDIISLNPALEVPGVVTIAMPLHTPIAERPLLSQCLTNLLDNAVKFVPAGVAPRIVVRTELKTEKANAGTAESHWVRIYVEDNGIGISSEYHDRIFGIFERLGREGDFPGTGIGLAIVTKAMQRMGGRVGLSSESGQGAKFWIELPARDS